MRSNWVNHVSAWPARGLLGRGHSLQAAFLDTRAPFHHDPPQNARRASSGATSVLYFWNFSPTSSGGLGPLTSHHHSNSPEAPSLKAPPVPHCSGDNSDRQSPQGLGSKARSLPSSPGTQWVEAFLLKCFHTVPLPQSGKGGPSSGPG